MTTGWLFDIYPLCDKMILWIKTKTKLHRIENKWSPSLYVCSDNKDKLKQLEMKTIPHVREVKQVKRMERVSDSNLSEVLQMTVNNSTDILQLAKEIQELDEYGVYRLYNVDIPPEQSYLYENNLYPLGRYRISKVWNEISSMIETDYTLPNFTKTKLKINPKKSQKIPKIQDRIKSIEINDITLESDSEDDMITDCIRIINKTDPDFIITENGDSWDLPYLTYRAKENNMSDELVLGRENSRLEMPTRQGTSFFAYGQIRFKPSAVNLLGRIHIDISNCFIWNNDSSIHGLFEIARTCRLPLQTAARASIGKCMSSIQFHTATRRGLLVPWRPEVSEIFKTRMKLLIGDRGGLVMEPRIGVFENVCELDFVSLFGKIILKKNISAETIDCSCCLDSESIVPDLGYHICEKKGIVPESLEVLLEKRQQYVDLIKTTNDQKKLEVYTERKSALKWILVTSFGYLGFNNAKFGRIDAHMAVCAFARQLLLRAVRIAETEGFSVLHGIVDSIWIQKKNATRSDYDSLKRRIETETDFDLALDIYNWIVFLPSKENKTVPVPNRYFGVKQNGVLKIRGIEARRHDTPEFFNKCQKKILKLFATCTAVSEVRESLATAEKIKEHYRKHLLNGEIPISDLVFTNRVTRGTDQNETRTVQADAISQLKWEGRTIIPGQSIKYIISDYSRKKSKRVIPLDMEPDKYDVKKYSELLDDCCNSIIEPFLTQNSIKYRI